MQRHTWTAEDDDMLLEAVVSCEAIFELYRGGEQNKRYGLGNAWDAVAGRLLPHVCVTGGACAARWRMLNEMRNDIDEDEEDAWERTTRMVEEYEACALERVDDAVVRIEGRVREISNTLAIIADAWDIDLAAIREERYHEGTC